MESLIDANIKKQLAEIFATLAEPVGILYFGSRDQNCEYCEDTLRMLSEIAFLSDLVKLKIYDLEDDLETADLYQVDQAPSIVLARLDDDGRMLDTGIRFIGLPAGQEFISFVRAILMVSAGHSGLSLDTRQFLRTLKKPIRLQVFVTPTCQYCPQVVVLAHQMAFESPLVEAEMIEAMEFPELAEEYGVTGVPHTVINDGAGEIIGAIPESQLVYKLQQVLADES